MSSSGAWGKLSGNCLMRWKIVWQCRAGKIVKHSWAILSNFSFPVLKPTSKCAGIIHNLARIPWPLRRTSKHFKNASLLLQSPFIISPFHQWQIEWIFIMKWKFLFISLSLALPPRAQKLSRFKECLLWLRAINLQICWFAQEFFIRFHKLRLPPLP